MTISDTQFSEPVRWRNRRQRLLRALAHPSLPLISGIAVAATYTVFGVLAYVRYPTAYSPLHNTLSQLGNVNLNPDGAPYYLVGCVLSGAAAIAFFASLSHWKHTGTTLQNRALVAVQTLGVIGGIGLIMNAVFPENQLPAHHFWAGVVFNSLGGAMLLSPLAFHRSHRFNPGVIWLPLAAVSTVILMFVFARAHLMEWPPVAMFLLSPILLGFHTRSIATRPPQIGLSKSTNLSSP